MGEMGGPGDVVKARDLAGEDGRRVLHACFHFACSLSLLGILGGGSAARAAAAIDGDRSRERNVT